ncbi:MAG: radical SAM protein [Clostridiales bacterium]|nr:radical SAM protein [Clostridiales bacterium]
MSTKRVELAKQLPLETPFSVHIFPMFYCNFKCNYCLHSLPDEKLKEMNFVRQKMSMDVYKKAIDDMAEFNQKLKALIFAGHGEPLLHKDIAEMVKYAKQKDVAQRIEIVTNGSLLTNELSDKLIDAGLDRLRVSLQGITSEKYKEISAVDIDINDIVKNLEYFCSKKKSTEVYVKIMDISMDSPDDFDRFKEMFKNACDISAVEYAIPFVNEVDYSNIGELSGKCKQGNQNKSNICSMPFYMLVVYPDGTVTPCCATSLPIKYKNVMTSSLKEIWNSAQRNAFLLKQLNGADMINICKDCSVPQFGLQSGDYLDDYKNELIEKYSKLK